MYNLRDVYGKRFFARRYKLNWRVPIVVDAINEVLQPKSVVDMGCATGDLVRGWQERGVEAYGVEGSEAVMDFVETKDVIVADLRVRQDLTGLLSLPWIDLVTCFEVLEHMEQEYVDALLYNLTLKTNQVLCSAAPPGQGGHHHVNCQPREYWIDRFNEIEWRCDERVVTRLRELWLPWSKKPGVKAYYDNLMFFERR